MGPLYVDVTTGKTHLGDSSQVGGMSLPMKEVPLGLEGPWP